MEDEPKKIGVGIIGFGTVGQGVAALLTDNTSPALAKTGVQLQLLRICDVDLARPRDVSVDQSLLTSRLEDILEDKNISVGVELIGGTDIARTVVERLLKAGKHVVTANKALLASHGADLFELAGSVGRQIRFEASCAGGIPLIGALENGLVANRIDGLKGIVNGTCNYILTCMYQKQESFSVALDQAQKAGYAEADPALDINGMDSAHKLAILATLAFGTKVSLDDIYVEGIDKVDQADLVFASELGYVMKLLAIAEARDQGISLRVHPAFLPRGSLLAQVNGAFNAVSVYGHAAGETLYYGMGAGRMPTASAIVADLVVLARSPNQQCSQTLSKWTARELPIMPIEDIESRYYIRVTALDMPGVMAKISGVLGDKNISLSAILQHESEPAKPVPVVIMTHLAREGSVRQALDQIGQLEVVSEPPVCIRVVEESGSTQQR